MSMDIRYLKSSGVVHLAIVFEPDVVKRNLSCTFAVG